jgi:hypothetical protein
VGLLGSLFGSTIGAALHDALQPVFDAFAGWAAQGAGWLLEQIGHVMSSTTTVDLGSSWFTHHERDMAALSAVVLLPMAFCGAIVAVYRQDASLLVRGFLVKLPLALLFAGVSVELVRMGLSVTDALSGYVLSSGAHGATDLIGQLGASLALGGVPFSGVSTFVMFIGAVLLAVAALVLWLELVVRAAAVAAATLFLPLALAGLVWPATAHWCRRLAETIAALVLSKLVIAAVLSLGAGAVAAGVTGPGDSSGGFSSVVVGIALLGVATFSPFALLRLVPAVESGAVAHLESLRHRLPQLATAPLRGADLAMQMASGAGLLYATPAGSELAGSASAGSASAGSAPAGSAPGPSSWEALAAMGAPPPSGAGTPMTRGEATSALATVGVPDHEGALGSARAPEQPASPDRTVPPAPPGTGSAPPGTGLGGGPEARGDGGAGDGRR